MLSLCDWLSLAPNSIAPNSELAAECKTHFSQGGEDIAINILLAGETDKGIFVDVGAYHPIRFSNTFMLYLQGWRGINIDGNAAAIEAFYQIRKDDLNIHALVSDKVEEIEFYRFAEGAWNTTDANAAKILQARNTGQTSIVAIEKMKTVPIMQILDQHVGSKKFDLLTIDIEGLDLRIFYSIDFNKYRPKVIALELSFADWMAEPLSSFIKKIGYEIYAQCVNTVILRAV